MQSDVIYDQEHWTDITFHFDNYSANHDGHILFFSPHAIEIDWIKITDDNTVLANPVMREPTYFSKDGFTINWDPVRRSYNYYIDLWKTVYTADKGVDVSFGFDTDYPDWLSCPKGEIVGAMGEADTDALWIKCDGEEGALVTTDFGVALESVKSSVKFITEEEDPNIVFYCDGYGENGWEPYGYFACDGFMTTQGKWYSVAVDGDSFAGKYTAVRWYTEGSDEDNKVYVDNIRITSKRPYVLERVINENTSYIYNPDNDDDDYNYYTYTGIGNKIDIQDPGNKGTSYTFTNLDPNGEYWYRVRSHYVSDFSSGEKVRGFGIAAPELLNATNIAEDTYTANWLDVPKAQEYEVLTYTAEIVDSDNDEYPILTEFFAGCNGKDELTLMNPVGNNSVSSLDEYTDLKGWSGLCNAVGDHMLGALDATGGYLVSPMIMSNPGRGNVFVYIEAMGTPGDNLYIGLIKSGEVAYGTFDENGEMNGWLELSCMPGEQLRIMSYNYLGFALTAFAVVQAAVKGDVVLRYDNSTIVPAGEQAATFTGLDNDLYAYTVVSQYYLENDKARSVMDKYILVDLKNGKSEQLSDIKVIEDEGIIETGRYDVQGHSVSKDYKGIVIVKYNNGTAHKIINR